MADYKVLCFSSDQYNLDELSAMTDKERYELASVAKSFGYDETDVLTLAEFQKLFNDGFICELSMHIFFYKEV